MYYSHSIVPGGFDVMSYTTLFIPSTSFIILDEIEERTSYGILDQSAVIASFESTAPVSYTHLRAHET